VTSIDLKGLHKVKRKLASGEVRFHFYAWRGGPALKGEPGSPEFLQSFVAATKNRKGADETKPIILDLIVAYQASPEFNKLSPASKRDYCRYLKLIESEFGRMPQAVLSDLRIRGEFKDWRDTMADRPRTADYAWTILGRLMAWAKDRGKIAVNPCEKGGRLYHADRADLIWGDIELEALRCVASKEVWAVVELALWTGQRQGDVIRATWSAIVGDKIMVKQAKTKARVLLPIGAELATTLAGLPKVATTILTSRSGRPWASDGFRTSFGRACIKAGIGDLNFHDLRGTAVTRMALAGCTVLEIAAVTGHSSKAVEAILDATYLGGRAQLAEQAGKKIEARTPKPSAV
jgi:integrase